MKRGDNMKGLIVQAKRWWPALVVAVGIAGNIAAWGYAHGSAARGQDDETAKLKETVATHLGDEKANRVTARVAALEQRTDGVPEQLRDIQRRLGNVEGQLQTLIRMIDRRAGGEKIGTACASKQDVK